MKKKGYNVDRKYKFPNKSYILIAAIISVMLILILISGCKKNTENPELSYTIQSPFNTYHDIPGLEQEDILAIESLLSQRASSDKPYFTYGMIYSTETFLNEEGETAINYLTGIIWNYIIEIHE